MKVKWLGHAAFLLTSDSGTRIVVDPYTTGGPIMYGEISETADAVTMSHTHKDHNNKAAAKGNPTVITTAPAEVKEIKITGIQTFHDEANGLQRGRNTIFCFDIDGMRLCHLGDLGHQLSEKQISEIGKVDILCIPVGGNYTVDAAGAAKVIDRLKPRVVLPMHYKTSKTSYPIAGIDEFLKGKNNVRRVAGSEVDFKAAQLPVGSEIIVLEPAL